MIPSCDDASCGACHVPTTMLYLVRPSSRSSLHPPSGLPTYPTTHSPTCTQDAAAALSPLDATATNSLLVIPLQADGTAETATVVPAPTPAVVPPPAVTSSAAPPLRSLAASAVPAPVDAQVDPAALLAAYQQEYLHVVGPVVRRLRRLVEAAGGSADEERGNATAVAGAGAPLPPHSAVPSLPPPSPSRLAAHPAFRRVLPLIAAAVTALLDPPPAISGTLLRERCRPLEVAAAASQREQQAMRRQLAITDVAPVLAGVSGEWGLPLPGIECATVSGCLAGEGLRVYEGNRVSRNGRGTRKVRRSLPVPQ